MGLFLRHCGGGGGCGQGLSQRGFTPVGLEVGLA